MGLKKSRHAAARQEEIKALDDLCRALVKRRDENRCRLCNRYVEGRACQWAHLIERDHWNVRWDLENSLVLCQSHHHYYTTHAKTEWCDVCEARMGTERWRALRLRGYAHTGKPDLSMWRYYLELMSRPGTPLPRPW